MAEEKLAAAVATAWYEKGIDNFVVVSGGLLAVARTHPHLIEGVLPMHLLAPPPRTSHRPSSRRPSSARACGADENGKVNLRQAVGARVGKMATAGMISGSAAARSIPRPVEYNSLRASAPVDTSFYTRSFDSNLPSVR